MDFGLTKEQNSWSNGSSSWCKSELRRVPLSMTSLWRRRRKTSRISIVKDGCWPISNENAAGSVMVYMATIRWHFFCSTNN